MRMKLEAALRRSWQVPTIEEKYLGTISSMSKYVEIGVEI